MARAGILCLVLALHAVASCPFERVGAAERLDPRAITASAEASSALASVGVHVPATTIVDRVAKAANAWCDVQDVLMMPIAPIFERLQVHQRWGLFTTAPASRWRIELAVRDGESAPWRVLYVPHDRRHRWDAERIEYRRMRGIWNPSDNGLTPPFHHFVGWAAREAFRRDPRATSMRARVYVLHLPPLGAATPSHADTTPHDETIVKRGAEDVW